MVALGRRRKRYRTFASSADLAHCANLHRKFGTTYYFATRLFPAHIRKRVHALYGFVRTPDEWVDNPDANPKQIRTRLQDYKAELKLAGKGFKPTYGVIRAFADVMRECAIPVAEPLRFLNAMSQDLDVTRYQTYEELRGYMRGSAAAVGVMMCQILCDPLDPKSLPYAIALGEAMQMTNFLRDIGEDAHRGRIYLPLEDLDRFGLEEQDILEGKVTEPFTALMRFEIERTRALYAEAANGFNHLPPKSRKAVRLAALLYERILNRIESNQYDVFNGRARTSKLEKLLVGATVLRS